MSKNKFTNSLKSENKKTTNSIFLAIFILFLIYFLLYSSFHTALFNGYTPQYEESIYSSILISSITLILVAIYFFQNWRLENYRDFLSIYIWLIPLSFWISTISAASVHLSKNMAYIHMMYATFFLVGLYVAKNRLGAFIIQLAITLSGYAVVLYGIANMFGNAYSRDAVMLTNQGYRLTSVFQYANAYAAFLMALLLSSLYYVVHSKKWYISFLHALMLVPITLSFWLTLSRGGIVTFPIIILSILPLLSLSRQIAFTVYSGIALLFALPITKVTENKSTEIVKQVWSTLKPDGTITKLGWFDNKSLSGWGYIWGFAILGAVIVGSTQFFVLPLLERKLEKFAIRKFSKVIFPVGLILAATIGIVLLFGTEMKTLLPDSLEKRIENIDFNQNSVLERGTFYKDSIRVFYHYPILGSGGGGWASLYERYQNNPYVSRQAHNFFLQYLVEVGIVGFVIFVLFLLLILFPFIRKIFKANAEESHSHLIFYFVAISLFIHSILDFEMSYVFLGALAFLSLGGMASTLDGRPVYLLRIMVKFHKKKFIYPTMVLGIALVFFIQSIVNYSADRSYHTSLQYARSGKNITEVLEPLNKAIKLRPNHPDYLVTKTDFMTQAFLQTKDDTYYLEAKKTIDHANKSEPNNRAIIEREFSLFMYKKQYQEALVVINEGLQKYNWELSFYERAAILHNELWNQARKKNNQTSMDQNWESLLELDDTVQKKITQLENLPKGQIQGRPFYESSLIRYSIGQIYFVKGDLNKANFELQAAAGEAMEKLKSDLQQSDLEQYKTVIRWYLALTIKQKKIDQTVYDTFTKAFPQEVEQINLITKALS